MEDNYPKACSEVLCLIPYLENSLSQKIPKEFINMLEKIKDESYEPNIDYNEKLAKQNLLRETRIILALIYRDYICMPEERKELIQEEKVKIEKEKEEKYNIDFNEIIENRRKNNIIEKLENTNNSMSLIETEEKKWYKKIIYKILKFFKLK